MKFYYNKILDDYLIYNNRVYFYNSPFCQWFPCKFVENDKTFTSTEQYMMYRKAVLMKDKEYQLLILNESNPEIIKGYGRKIKNFNQELWDKCKEKIVYTANILKFTQDGFCNSFILNEAFNNKEFVESSPYDTIWGVGLHYSNSKILNKENWNGANLLGKILTKVRKEIIIRRRYEI